MINNPLIGLVATPVATPIAIAAADLIPQSPHRAFVPDAPTIGAATAGDTEADVEFTAPTFAGSQPITGYTATSTPGGITASGESSPITVTGLTNGIEYTFAVHATSVVGNSAESAASNAATPAGDWAATLLGTGYIDQWYYANEDYDYDRAPDGLLRWHFSDGQNADGAPFADDDGYTNRYTGFTANVTTMTVGAATTKGKVIEILIGENYDTGEAQIAGPLFDPREYVICRWFQQYGQTTGTYPASFAGWPTTLETVAVAVNSTVTHGVHTGTIPDLSTAPFASTISAFYGYRQNYLGIAGDVPGQILDYQVWGNPNMLGQPPLCRFSGSSHAGGPYGNGTCQFFVGTITAQASSADGDPSGYEDGAADDLSNVTGTDPLWYSCNNTNRSGTLSIVDDIPVKVLVYEAIDNPGLTGMTGPVPAQLSLLRIAGCNFNQAAVDNVIALLKATPYSQPVGEAAHRTIYLGNPGAPPETQDNATPSAQGLSDIADMVALGDVFFYH